MNLVHMPPRRREGIVQSKQGSRGKGKRKKKKSLFLKFHVGQEPGRAGNVTVTVVEGC